MRELPAAVRRYLVAFDVVAAATLLVQMPLLWTTPAIWSVFTLWQAAIFIVLTYLADRTFLRVRETVTHSVDTVANVAAILVLPRPLPALVALTVLTISATRDEKPLYKHVFNIAHGLAIVTISSTALSLIGPAGAILDVGRVVPALPALAVVLAGYYALDAVPLIILLALFAGHQPWQSARALRQPLWAARQAATQVAALWAQLSGETWMVEIAAALCGVLAAVVWHLSPVLTLLLIVPVAALHSTYKVIGKLESSNKTLAERHEQLQAATLETVTAMARAVDAKDTYTLGHCERVSDYAGAIGAALGLDAATVARLRRAGLLHDVGKIGVPDAVLQKVGPLSDDEYTLIKEHPAIGERLLSGVAALQEILPAVRHHHERWDGTGYPDRLCAATIPLDAVILAVADSFDAMTTTRTYRPAFPAREALRRLRAGRGTQFDERAVAAFELAIALGLVVLPPSPAVELVTADHSGEVMA